LGALSFPDRLSPIDLPNDLR